MARDDQPGGALLDLIQVRPLVAADLLVTPGTLVFTAPENGQCPSIGQAVGAAAVGSKPSPSRKHEDLPSLLFEPNVGQADPKAEFLARGRGYALSLSRSEAVLALTGEPAKRQRTEAPMIESGGPVATVRLKFGGASGQSRLEPMQPTSGKSHYLLGRDPTTWRVNVPQYGAVRQKAVYPGIDLEFYGTEGRLEHDWILAPGADHRRIDFSLEGARSLKLDARGDLIVGTTYGDLRFRKPHAYMGTTPTGPAVEVSYRVAANGHVGFEVAPYDRHQTLVIDPVLVYSSSLAGVAYATAVDGSGNVYLTGTAGVPQPPTSPGAVLGPTGLGDAFVTKLTANGESVVYTTYFGGSSTDTAYAVGVDSSGQAAVAGLTRSPDFPTANAARGSFGGGTYDGFAAKLTADGTGFVYSTYLGGASDDWAWGLAVDGSGSAYVTGVTGSTDFPIGATSGVAFQPTLNQGSSVCPTCTDAFVTKLGPTGGLAYSTYLGGRWSDGGTASAVDGAGQAHVTGYSQSTDLPIAGNLFNHDSNGLPPPAAFFSKFDASGTFLVRSSWLNDASSWSYGNAIAVDGSGAVYVAGSTQSSNYPTTPGALQTLFGGGPGDGFVTKIDSEGVAYSTFLGGSGEDRAEAIAVDSVGRAHVVGTTTSADYPLTSCLRGFAGGRDAFVTRLSAIGDAAEYSTFFGGSGNDEGLGVAFDPGGDAVVVGTTLSEDFPLLGGLPSSGPGGGFVARVSASSAASAGTLGFVSGQYQVSETAASVTLQVMRQCGTQGAASVQFASAGGSAIPGVNYGEVSGSLSFADGEAGPKSITVPILDDGFINCGGLGFGVTLDGATGADLAFRNAGVLIQEADQGRTQFRRSFEVRDRYLTTGPQWQAAVGSDSPWLTLSSYTGTGPSQVEAIVDITGLVAGQYVGTITVAALGAANSPVQIAVDLYVEFGGGGGQMQVRTTAPPAANPVKKGGRP